MCELSYVQLFAVLWTVAHQATLPMEFSRQEYWRSCHFLLQGIFLIQGLNLCVLHLLHWQADSQVVLVVKNLPVNARDTAYSPWGCK